MALVTTKAIVLKSMRWGEADRILTFYSLQLGKVRGIARGARRMKSRFGGMLEPFSSINLTLFEKRRDDLASVSHADILEPFFAVRECLERISAASCMVALIEGITADRDPGPPIFHTLLESLRSLVRTDDPGLLTLMFQMHVLGQSGFRPQLGPLRNMRPGSGGAAVRLFPRRRRTGVRRLRPGPPGRRPPHVSGQRGVSSTGQADALCGVNAAEGRGSGAE